jgi:hypothetical protein
MAEAVQEQHMEATGSELEQPRWAVISFERREGAGLTYPQAVDLLKQLESRKVTGLAIVTDEAAAKISD